MKRPLLSVLLILLVVGWLWAQAPELVAPDWSRVADVASRPELNARAAILIDVASRTVLFEKAQHLVIPPASLTKIVAVDVALDAARRGELDLDEIFQPHPDGWAINQPPGSSLMFLGPGQRLSVRELLLGIVVSSGNDAGVALAHLLSGGVGGFVELMNRRVGDLGLRTLYFTEPAGLSPQNTITAYEFSRFLLEHLEQFPDTTEWLYPVPDFTYPQTHNVTDAGTPGPVLQYNRNSLVRSYPGVDGLKTGFIDESGYHIAVTAERDGRRLLAVVLGVDAASHSVGAALRAQDAESLLDYGYQHFELLPVGYPSPEPVRVFGGRETAVTPSGPPQLWVSLPTGAMERLEGNVSQALEAVAPIEEGRVVGSVEIRLDTEVLVRADLVFPEVPRGGLFRRAWDGLVIFVRRLFGRPIQTAIP